LEVLVSQERGKPENLEEKSLGEKSLGARREPTTNPTLVWHRARIEPDLTTGPTLLLTTLS